MADLSDRTTLNYKAAATALICTLGHVGVALLLDGRRAPVEVFAYTFVAYRWGWREAREALRVELRPIAKNLGDIAARARGRNHG